WRPRECSIRPLAFQQGLATRRLPASSRKAGTCTAPHGLPRRLGQDARLALSIHRIPPVTVERRIRQMIEEGGGRAPAERVVREALGVQGARGVLARKLAEAALREMPGLALSGDDVVERAPPPAGRVVALALAPAATPTALPPAAAWLSIPPGGETAGEPVVIALSGPTWRTGAATLARDLAGAQVLALSA